MAERPRNHASLRENAVSSNLKKYILSAALVLLSASQAVVAEETPDERLLRIATESWKVCVEQSFVRHYLANKHLGLSFASELSFVDCSVAESAIFDAMSTAISRQSANAVLPAFIAKQKNNLISRFTGAVSVLSTNNPDVSGATPAPTPQISASATVASCQVAEILFGEIAFVPVAHGPFDPEVGGSVIVRSTSFDDNARPYGSILGEITVDRGGFSVRSTRQVVVGVISTKLVAEGWDDSCNQESNIEIVKIRSGTYAVLSDGTPMGTIEGEFPRNNFGL
jgi:hypothetical protein